MCHVCDVCELCDACAHVMCAIRGDAHQASVLRACMHMCQEKLRAALMGGLASLDKQV